MTTATVAEKPRWIGIERVAAMLGVSPQTVYVMARNGEIPAIRVRRQWRFDEVAVQQHLRSQNTEVAAA